MQKNQDKRKDFDFGSVRNGNFPAWSYLTPKKKKPKVRREIVVPRAPFRENKPTEVVFDELPNVDLMNLFAHGGE